MLNIDLTGRRALVAGVADDQGYGFAIAKALAEAGATVCTGTWPPALNIFLNLLERGKIDESRRLADGSTLTFEKIYPLDAAYDTLADAPEDVRSNKRYKDVGDFSVDGLVQRLKADFGERPLDIVIHSLANGPEVKKALVETSRAGYLTAVSVSAYSLVSLVGRMGPLMRPGGSFLSLTYMASERVVPGYGGGLSSAQGALGSDTRTPADVTGRQRHRQNRAYGGVLRRKRAAHRAADGARGGHHGRFPGEPPGQRDHRDHDLRGQRLSLDGDVGGGGGGALGARTAPGASESLAPSPEPLYHARPHRAPVRHVGHQPPHGAQSIRPQPERHARNVPGVHRHARQ